MNGLRLKASTGVLEESDVVQINTLLTSSPGALYKLPVPAQAGGKAPAKPAATADRRGTRRDAGSPRS
ncbi:hypothetical protein D3C72_1416900 [compost metagenome]